MMILRSIGFLLLCGAAAPAWAGGSLQADPWTGVYAGATAAASRNVIKGYTTQGDGSFGGNASDESARIHDRAHGFGVFAGARRRFDPGIVAGLEVDLTRLGHKGENFDIISGTTEPSASLRYDTNWLATARMTAGWSFGDVLVYGTGGAAFATEKERRTQYELVGGVAQARFTEKDDAIRYGFALGAGAEWRITGAWSLRAEYLHVRFADEKFRFPDARGGAQGSYTTVQGRLADNTGHMNLVRIGVAYTFGTDR